MVVAALLAAALWLAPAALASGWCGTGESSVDRPDTTAGPQIHAIVVTTSDAPDNFVADANRLADDVASIASWWQGQDPTRVPRFDTASFPGGNCLDISFVRLTQTTLPYADANTLFVTIEDALEGIYGFTSPFERYLVYFDGRTSDPSTCGVGNGPFDFSDTGFAIVVLGDCTKGTVGTDVPSDHVAAHELLHALGAVPPSDPNHLCQGSHVCDSPTDVLYPTTSGAPLQSEVLDYNHDDYYGHAPGWPDLKDSGFLHVLGVQQVPLTVTPTGVGTVESDVPGLLCSALCTTQWDPGTLVHLDAHGNGTTRFVRWGGACSGTASCALTLNAATSVTALFGPLRIPLSVSVSGRGRVACTPGCPRLFTAGKVLALRAVPAKGWRFAGWSGGCTGTRPVCTPATDFALTVRATFRKR